jgi:histone H3/H4
MEGSELTSEKVSELLREAGAEEVEGGAVDEMMDVLGDYAFYLSSFALQVAQHSGRAKVERNDIRLAAMNVTLGAGRLSAGVMTAARPHERET